MSGFDDAWLGLREPADARARSSELESSLAPFAATHAALEVVDLGTGTGANLRYLAPRLGGRQRWTLTDDDPALLGAIARASRDWARAVRLEARSGPAELGFSGAALELSATLCEIDLAGSLEALALPAGGLVTCSALLDLVSRPWLERLAARSAAASAACLFALSYDGRAALTPGEPFDAEVVALVNRHQMRDKGFGPALGPGAADAACAALAAHGYRVERAASDWRLDAAEPGLIEALLRGWADAAAETAPERGDAIAAWLVRRLTANARGGLAVTVGHVDVLAVPAGQY